MDLPKRKPTRLKDFDYSSQGAYFVTICTYNKQKILCNIVGEGCGYLVDTSAKQKHRPRRQPRPRALPSIKLTSIGEIAEQELLNIEKHYDNIKIDKYVIMPNHIHLIIKITERINPLPTKRYDISNIIGKYKAAVTRNVGNAFMHSVKHRIWQTSFHDHIIRGENDYLKIWEYIDTNPLIWEDDCFYT